MAKKSRSSIFPSIIEVEKRIRHAALSGKTVLILSGMEIKTLPGSIGRLTHLEHLDISNNWLRKLPDSIGKLTQLRGLYINHNRLKVLPEFIGRLTQLQELDVSRNRLSALPDVMGRLSRLQKLYIGGNQLTIFPDFIAQLTQLQELDISLNLLTILPDVIGQLTKLEFLGLVGNELSGLPESICQLTQLQALDTSYNKLTELPQSIGKLTQLIRLGVSNNRLQILPESLKQLISLKALFLHGNDALDIPSEVLGSSVQELTPSSDKVTDPREILEYYFRTREGRKPLNEAKLILVGYGGVGKTSLVNQLERDKFDPHEKRTPGIRITQWPVTLGANEEVRLHIWDFGGQEILHSTHQFFLTQRSLYILVLNGRQGHEDHDAEYWLNLIQSFGGDSPVIVVLNKIKADPFDVNRRGLKEKFPTIRAFVQTDCADGTGIDELRQIIKKETDHLEHLRDAFPAAWFGIKDRLAGMPENYLSFDRYREICREHGETDMQAQEDLAVYLHSLGIALNYKDDPRLRDTHVLNPLWVTNGIYQILDAPQIACQEGELRVADLAGILDQDAYPGERHAFLLELMRRFGLCFSFPEEEGHYLIPDLLDKQQPPEAEEFKPADCLNFQYHYPALPEGLLPRFIVRSHALSIGLPRWRTGVILKFEGNRALVKADKQDRRVAILVDGDSMGRRRLLAVIRSDFERLHGSFIFNPLEMVPLPEYPEVMVNYRDLIVRERTGKMKFSEVIKDQVIEIDVQKLLNGVDLEGTRPTRPGPEQVGRPVRLFYSYSHRDEALRDELETHLKLLQRQGLIEPWHDRRITGGEEWKGQIDANLERADIILLLVSADFIASDYCYDIEMRRAMERHDANEARVVPVIVRDVNWNGAPFSKLQAFPIDGKAVMIWPNKDTAWRNVAEGIEKVIKELRKK